MNVTHRHSANERSARVARGAIILGIMVALASCARRPPQPLTAPTAWQAYRAEGAGYGTEVPSGWTITERAGVAGYGGTTIRANEDNWIVVSKRFLPGGLEANIIRGDTRDQAIIGAVQAHYDELERDCLQFHGDAPEVGGAGRSMGGSGTFTCEQKGGFGRGTVRLQGFTVLIIGLNNLYLVDAFADPQSATVIRAAFDRIVGSFTYED